MERKTEVQLQNAPADVISSVKFSPNSNQYLLAASWDCTVRVYDVINNNLRQKYLHEEPVLDIAFQDPVHTLSGGLDKTLKLYDLNAHTEVTIGSHSEPTKCTEYASKVNGVLTGSWDKTIKLWEWTR